MENSARVFNCAKCARQVIICSCCDRNNIYCSRECAQLARIQSLREAGWRYQNSLRGRHKHADRQRCYRQRLANKVTHHTSLTLFSNDLMDRPCKPCEACKPKQRLTQSASICCDFCGKVCAPFLRSGFLPRRTDQKMRYFPSWPGGP